MARPGQTLCKMDKRKSVIQHEKEVRKIKQYKLPKVQHPDKLIYLQEE